MWKLLLILFLSGCSDNNLNTGKDIKEWVDPDILIERDGVYCYDTLAKPDCYRTPQRGQVGKLRGSYGPPPP